MHFIRRNVDIKSLCNIVRFYSSRKNHYEVLNLHRNCTEKDIKEAFIQMSKEYHPDKNKDASAQAKFVRIVEAYNVLGKPNSRAQYDSIREVGTRAGQFYRNNQKTKYTQQNYYEHYDFYKAHASAGPEAKYQEPREEKEQAHQRASDSPYYGLHGIKKMPNLFIIIMCFGFAFVGVLLQIVVIRQSFFNHRRALDEKSMRLAAELDRVRSAARENGNEIQTRLLLDKIVTAANPTVATASLGQALANEKKDAQESLLTELGAAKPEDRTFNSPVHSNVAFEPFPDAGER